jgi:hypothetical protein
MVNDLVPAQVEHVIPDRTERLYRPARDVVHVSEAARLLAVASHVTGRPSAIHWQKRNMTISGRRRAVVP